MRKLADRDVLGTFIRFDIVAAAISCVLVIVVQLAALDEPSFWVVPIALALLVGLLIVARSKHRSEHTSAAFALVAVGNWIVAIVVPLFLPFLWPVLVVAALVPVVLAAPSVGRRATAIAIGAGAAVVATIAVIGLLGDDGGVLPDVDDDFELVLVVSSLAALSIPIGLVVSRANTLQQRSLVHADELNAELRQSEVDLAASRRRVVDASDAARSRIERNLHDGAQQRLVALGVHLRLLESVTADGDHPDDLPDTIAVLVSELDLAIDELRELAHGIYPPLLEARGLAEAFGAVARRSPIPIEIAADGVGRFAPSVEAALYFTGLEALANATKHAGAADVRLVLTSSPTHGLTMTVTDDGPGFDVDQTTNSGGMFNMADRIAAVGGTFDVESTVGTGTRLVARVPAPVAPGC